MYDGGATDSGIPCDASFSNVRADGSNASSARRCKAHIGDEGQDDKRRKLMVAL